MIMIRRIAIYLIIALVSLGFLYLIENKPPLIPHGIYLPATEQNFPANQGKVHVVQTLPMSSKAIGVINLQMRLKGDPSEADEQQIMAVATQMAGQNGADRIALTYFFASQGQGEGNKSYLLQARAFRTR